MEEKKSLKYSVNESLMDNLYPYLEAEHACIVCGNTHFTVWAKEGYLEAKKCISCSMISVNPHFTEEGLKLVYSEYFSHRKENHLLNEQRDKTYLIDRDWVSQFVKSGVVLDVGCSGGYFLSKFAANRWERYGVEIAVDAGKFAIEHFNLPVSIGNVQELEFERQFDLIMMRGTIEHMYDPIKTLEKCCQLLKPYGFLFITATPAGDSFAFDVYRENGDYSPHWNIYISFRLIY